MTNDRAFGAQVPGATQLESNEPEHRIEVARGKLSLPLHRYRPERQNQGSVLLIHGASANSATFLVPDGGLVGYLVGRGWDVWTLDWRGSHDVVDVLPEGQFLDGSLAKECALFTLDRVVEEDFPQALAYIRRVLKAEREQQSSTGSPIQQTDIAVVAHCLGAGAFSIALSRRKLSGIANVVLSALGLFYEAPWDGWVKVEDFLIERILGAPPTQRAVDPRKSAVEWAPKAMRVAYDHWPKRWLPPPGPSKADRVFHLLSYMFGQPYLRERLAPGIHGPQLLRLFGGMHLGMYLHAGQMLRRGYAAPIDRLDVIDRSRFGAGPAREKSVHTIRGDLDPTGFLDKRITLITGAQNRLWHRDSIDLMYEFLRGAGAKATAKCVLDDYAHQDLLWGYRSKSDVYPVIAAGIDPAKGPAFAQNLAMDLFDRRSNSLDPSALASR